MSASISTPATGCRLISSHSSGASLPGLFRISDGMISLPTSCTIAPMRNQNSSRGSSPARNASAHARSATRSQ